MARAATPRVAAVVAGLLLALVLGSLAEARQWAWLGVRIRDLSEQEAEEVAAKHGIREGFGVVVVDVLEETPAGKSGLRPGDIVVAFGGRPVVESRLLQRLIAEAAIDTPAQLTVLRPEGRRVVEVRLGRMPPAIAGERVAAEFGFALREVPSERERGVLRPQGPPTVAIVTRGGAAAQAGLEPGDVILQVGENAVVTADAAREALAAAGLDRPLRLTVRRDEQRVAVTIPTTPARP